MRYYSFNNYLREKFGVRVHRVPLNAGFTCPNKDGTLSGEGCIFCNEEGFSIHADTRLSLKDQIEKGMGFAAKRYNAEKFIAYFQNASGTYADIKELKESYDIIKRYPDVVGLFISTRPDCIDEEKLELIASYNEDYDVWIEYGVQTVHDRTLEEINRLHTFSQAKESIVNTDKMGIKVGVHIILGLPGESVEDMLATAETLSKLPVSGMKLHVLHVLKGTRLEKMFNESRGTERHAPAMSMLSRDEYVNISCKFLERMPRRCVVLRLVSDAKEDFLVAPEWIKEKQGVIRDIEKRLAQLDTFQGRLV